MRDFKNLIKWGYPFIDETCRCYPPECEVCCAVNPEIEGKYHELFGGEVSVPCTKSVTQCLGRDYAGWDDVPPCSCNKTLPVQQESKRVDVEGAADLVSGDRPSSSSLCSDCSKISFQGANDGRLFFCKPQPGCDLCTLVKEAIIAEPALHRFRGDDLFAFDVVMTSDQPYVYLYTRRLFDCKWGNRFWFHCSTSDGKSPVMRTV